ncbi:uncharacterized protein LOC9659766 [Selaginella moellendorffii]|nr:uncharacterized protein LOC9659766 [Selaginella moellendorffii]|eukprot:XP_002979111.2 uncharacterized protein LOC9659766 [Selaginella moellendorffii]
MASCCCVPVRVRRECCRASIDTEQQRFAVATPSRTVSIFWDLDNKPPALAPFTVAMRLKSAAGAFGCVRETIALANRHAFIHIPEWVREQRRERKILDILEKTGRIQPPAPYECNLCGRKCKTNLDLKKHFKQLHERERGKRIARLNQLTGKRRAKFQSAIAAKEQRYRAACSGGMGTAAPAAAGYGLAAELRRAGVSVRTVSDKPDAADEALKRRMEATIFGAEGSGGSAGENCVCLVSDDSGFGGVLRDARRRRARTVVIGSSGSLRRYSDAWLSWEDVMSGLGQRDAAQAAKQWLAQDLLARELLDVEELASDGGHRQEHRYRESEENGVEDFLGNRSRVVYPESYREEEEFEEDFSSSDGGDDQELLYNDRF